MSVKRPGFLCIPAYVVGATAAAASASLLPPIIGVPIGGVIAIVLLTPISLLHRFYFQEGNFVIYGLATIASLTFACHFIAPDFGPAAIVDASNGTKFSWIQIAFIAAQQACYFGIHAFAEDEH